MTTERPASWRRRRDVKRRQAVWRKTLVPLGRDVSGFGELGLPVGGSTWVAADPDAPALFARDPDELEQDLSRIWQRGGRTRLVPLAGPIAELAARARRAPLVTHDEVSSDVYAMQ